MQKTSIIIPAREEPLLQKTINSILENAAEDIEILVMLDGYWPEPPLNPDKQVTAVHTGKVCGMRRNINAAATIATGKYLMKLDAHCMLGENFDRLLKENCEENWISVPSRYSLDRKKWKRFRGPIDYLYLTFPYTKDNLYGSGFHGKKWKGPTGEDGSWWHMEKKNKKKKIDDIMIFQGSCWFMHKTHFFNIDCMDETNYNIFQEATELSFKTWLSGGRVIRNKNTWYAHYHKRQSDNWPNYSLSKRKKIETTNYMVEYWLNNMWPKQTIQFKDFIEKFLPLHGWPHDWNHKKYRKQ
jgi:glycosyltransferase involved in cell wall biosynthesis